MKAFSALIDALTFAPSDAVKLRHLVDYFARSADPDRGLGLALLTGAMTLPSLKPALLRSLAAERFDSALFESALDYAGDFGETVALSWPDGADRQGLTLSQVAGQWSKAGKAELPGLLAGWLDAAPLDERCGLLRLLTGKLRLGVSPALARRALAGLGDRPVREIEAVWPAMLPPYESLLAWLEGRAARPEFDRNITFYPVIPNRVIMSNDLEDFDSYQFSAFFSLGGARVQLSAQAGGFRLITEEGDEIGAAFPEIMNELPVDGVFEGELLVLRNGGVPDAGGLQRRLAAKRVSARMLGGHPVTIRLLDMLADGVRDIRALPFPDRRALLEARLRMAPSGRADLPPMVEFSSWSELDAVRRSAAGPGVSGLVLRRHADHMGEGWLTWMREPHRVSCIVMYAQCGTAERATYFTHATVGVWQADGEGGRHLVPVGKAEAGDGPEERDRFDRFVRDNTLNRFGPVREVAPQLLVELAFDRALPSSRRKAGLTLQAPRIKKVCWDRPPAGADTLDELYHLAGLPLPI